MTIDAHIPSDPLLRERKCPYCTPATPTATAQTAAALSLTSAEMRLLRVITGTWERELDTLDDSERCAS